MTTRRQARAEALQILYAQELTGKPLDEILGEPEVVHSDDLPFCEFTQSLAKKAFGSSDECDELVDAHSRNWSFARIAILDKIIFRIAISEFLHFPDIPPKVSIDEAVELAKKYSTGKSGRFINGMLDSILNDLLKRKKIFKNISKAAPKKKKQGSE